MKKEKNKVGGIKLAYVGGGSRGWAWGLMGDLALEESLSGEIRLYDIDLDAAQQNVVIGKKYFGAEEAKTKWDMVACETLDEALQGADFVVISIQPATYKEMESDVHAPEKYGIYQAVGDTTGPGGIIRALRTIPMFKEIALGIQANCPNAWVINYTNPMTICTKTLYEVFPQIKAFGCCHEVFGTQKLLAMMLNDLRGISEVERHEILINVLGINHFTWIDQASYQGMDLLPLYKEFVKKYEERGFEDGAPGYCETSVFGSANMVKFDLFRRYGLIAAAGDRHLAEFCPPWYIKDKETVAAFRYHLTPVSFREQELLNRKETSRMLIDGEKKVELKRSGEEGIHQIMALLGLGDLVTNVNLPNVGQISNLPLGAVVETNACFDQSGIRPVLAGRLPEDINSLVYRQVINQETTVKAGLTYSLENEGYLRCLLRESFFLSFLITFSIPIFIGSLGYVWGGNIVKEITNLSYVDKLKQVLSETEQSFNKIDKLSQTLSETQWIRNIAFMQGQAFDTSRLDYFELSRYAKELENYSSMNNMVEKIAIVLNQKNGLISANGYDSFEWYFENAFKLEGMETEDWMVLFSEPRNTILYPRNVQTYSILRGNMMAAEGIIKSLWTTPDRVPHKNMWLWDSVFHALGWQYYDKELAYVTVTAVLDSQREDGLIPIMTTPHEKLHITQPPVLAWGIWLLYERFQEKDFLAKAYEPLKRYLQWNLQNRDANKNLLCEWHISGTRSGESGADNSCRFDSGKTMDCVDFSSFMAKEVRHLVKMAEVLDLGLEAKEHESLYQQMKEAINTQLWDEEKQLYCDRYLDGGFSNIKGLYSFMPLFAAVVDEDRVAILVKQLKNPSHFMTKVPFATDAASEPTYGCDLWRGSCWINYNYMLISGLREYGYPELANKIALASIEQIAKWYHQLGCIFEYYDSSGEKVPSFMDRKGPCTPPYDIRRKIFPIRDYSWTSSLYIALLNETSKMR